MTRPKLVVVGNGMAGIRTLEHLFQIAPERFDVTVFGAEPHPNYNRILLSPVLAGEMTPPDIVLNGLDWYAQHGIRLHLGRAIVAIDRLRREVVADDGSRERYDRLLLATGSTPFVLPVPGRDLDGVISYRDLHDTETMIRAAGRFTRALVIGGGLLGLEAANGLARRGMAVTVVHLMPWLMERQLDAVAAGMLCDALRERGIDFRLAAKTQALHAGPDGRVAAVELESGERLAADLVVMAVGIRPNIALAQAAGLHCDRGIVVSDTLQTFDPRIYAVGECVAHRGVAYGLVAPLYDMAKVCATHLAGVGLGRYQGSTTATKLKVTGIDLFSAGDFTGRPTDEHLSLHDAEDGVYRKVVLRAGKLLGCVMYGETHSAPWLMDLMNSRADVSAIRDALLFGRDVATAVERAQQEAQAARGSARARRDALGDMDDGNARPARGEQDHSLATGGIADARDTRASEPRAMQLKAA
jgi:nitrite reductase (NADH) large subunit